MKGIIDILIREKKLSGEKADRLIRACTADGCRLSEAAPGTGLVSEADVLSAFSEVFGLPVKDSLDTPAVPGEWTERVPRSFLKHYLMVPLAGDVPAVALNDPTDLNPLDDLASLAGLAGYSLVLAPKQAILHAVNAAYDLAGGDSAEQMVADLGDDIVISDIEETADLLDDTSDAPVIRLVNQMIFQAVKAGASDLHIEPFQDTLKIRYRIDGILYEMLTPPKGVQASLVSRIKVMASMNIAEKRVPQDGRAQVRIGTQEVDLRISTVPTGFGERLVIRLLNKSGYFLSLGQFGMPDVTLARLNTIIRRQNGIVLVTGPTGSGKTTTLYAGLSEINAPDKNILTIEDPVEYNLEGIGQIPVNVKTGVTFASGLRAIVRQDPDVILVGEIRDFETASIAIQSALTGHLVFSTLHTNDAAGAVTRLVDLGVEPYLISSSVNTVIAQRLVRLLCPRCRRPYRVTADDIESIGEEVPFSPGHTVYKPEGCPHCFQTGYTGRQAIFEIMDLDEDLRSLVLQTSDANRIRKTAVEKGMASLRQDGMAKARDGLTSIREVLRVTQG